MLDGNLSLNLFTNIDQYQDFIKIKTLTTCIMKKAPIKRGSKMDFLYPLNRRQLFILTVGYIVVSIVNLVLMILFSHYLP